MIYLIFVFLVLFLLYLYSTENESFFCLGPVTNSFLFSLIIFSFFVFLFASFFPPLIIIFILIFLKFLENFWEKFLSLKELFFVQNFFIFILNYFFLIINTFFVFLRCLSIGSISEIFVFEIITLDAIGLGGLLKNVDTPGRDIVVYQARLNQEHYIEGCKIINKELKPFYKQEIAQYINPLAPDERIKALSFLEFKAVHLFDKENEQKNEALFVKKLQFKSETEKALQKIKVIDSCEKTFREYAQSVSKFQSENYQNEMAQSYALKEYAKNHDKELSSLLMKVADVNIFKQEVVSPGKIFLTVYADDNISDVRLKTPKIEGTTYAEYYGGVESKGQDIRSLILSKGNLSRPSNGGTYDYCGSFAQKEGIFENKNILVQITGKYSSNFISAFENRDCFEKFIQEDVSGMRTIQDVLKKEAIPTFDLTQNVALFASKFVDSSEKEMMLYFHKLLGVSQEAVNAGKTVIYFSYAAPGKEFVLLCEGKNPPVFIEFNNEKLD